MLNIYVRVMLLVAAARSRAERGLSQSTENAVLLAGAIAIAGVVITLVGAYVKEHLPK